MSVSIQIPGATFTKQVASLVSPIRFTGLSTASETYTGVGYNYTFATRATTDFLNTALQKLPAGVDGYLEATIVGGYGEVANASFNMMVSPVNSTEALPATDVISMYVGVDARIRVIQSGGATIDGNVSPNLQFVALGTTFRFTRVGSAWTGSVSLNGGAFQVVHNFATTSATDMYLAVDSRGTASDRVVIKQPQGYRLVTA